MRRGERRQGARGQRGGRPLKASLHMMNTNQELYRLPSVRHAYGTGPQHYERDQYGYALVPAAAPGDPYAGRLERGGGSQADEWFMDASGEWRRVVRTASPMRGPEGIRYEGRGSRSVSRLERKPPAAHAAHRQHQRHRGGYTGTPEPTFAPAISPVSRRIVAARRGKQSMIERFEEDLARRQTRRAAAAKAAREKELAELRPAPALSPQSRAMIRHRPDLARPLEQRMKDWEGRRRQYRQRRQQEKAAAELQGVTFHPNISERSRTLLERSSHPAAQQSVLRRMDYLNRKASERKEHLARELDEARHLECTFQPQMETWRRGGGRGGGGDTRARRADQPGAAGDPYDGDYAYAYAYEDEGGQWDDGGGGGGEGGVGAEYDYEYEYGDPPPNE